MKMRKSSPFRTLFAVYAVAILAGFCEFIFTSGGERGDPDIYGNPKNNFPAVILRLYPGTPEAEYLLGRRFEAEAGQGFNREEIQRNPALLQKFMTDLSVDLNEAARHYERAISMGLKSEESLYYNYALTLIRTQAEPAKIDQAIAAWHRNFPFSERRDLSLRRQSIEQQLQQLPGATKSSAAESSASIGTLLKTNGLLPSRELQSLKQTGSNTPSALDFDPEYQPRTGYVGSQSCRECHSKQFESFLETAHSRALTDVHPEDEPSDTVFDHSPSGRRYRVARREGQLIHEEIMPFQDGTELVLTRTPVRYRVGSGHFARTYLCDAGGGFLFESPITWYESAQKWDMTPGFDKPAHRSFSRPILENCLGCHTGQTEMSTTSNFRLRLIENSIGCERCHGPGETHVKSRLAGTIVNAAADDSIVNPGRLDRKLAEAVCQQCHLQGDIHIGGHNVRAADYRPGHALEEFSTVYRLRKSETEMTVVGHVEQLQESACYRKSETLTCVTCHNPHRSVTPADRTEHYRSACLKCHAEPGCKLPISTRQEKADNDCIQCHMPKSKTEVPHLAFTHHHIGTHPLNKPAADNTSDPLIPLSDLSGLSEFDRTRSRMLAELQMFLVRGPDFQKSQPGQMLAQRIDRWLMDNSSPSKDVDVEVVFARSQFQWARGDAVHAEQTAMIALGCDRIRSEEQAAILGQLGELAFRKKSFEEARNKYELLARIQCQGHDWYYLGICEEQGGDRRAAIRAFERAWQLAPASIEIGEALARTLHEQGELAAEQRPRALIAKLRLGLPSIAMPHPNSR